MCQSCGHAARGQRKAPAQQSPVDTPRVDPDTASSPETTEKHGGTPDHRQETRRARPPRPKATDERVEELLRAAGYNRAITPEVLEEHRRFTTHAGKTGLPRWKAAVALLNGAQGRGEVPHVREIYTEEKRRREAKQARAAETRRQAGELADEHAKAAREHVARVWAETGEGPTWRELADALGVEGRIASAVIDTLHRLRVLTSTKEPRSLTLTTAWTPPSA
ncbi:hypothetical protein Noca_4739 (plasmid) [Nocardioides sp. JS614]|nr:hypothetical protein Noca_4739 [Nocardioides sp. JS614]